MSEKLNLSENEVRVLGCLLEKRATTPDQYPLTLNALRTACNQKTNRYPVVSYHEGEVGHAARSLEEKGLLKVAWAARSQKYEHQIESALGIRQKDVAVLCPLMLRGPQTAGEIRTRCARLYAFDDLDDVEYVLNRLADRDPALIVKLPRLAGHKEQRYAHLLAGEPDLSDLPPPSAPAARASDLEQRVSALESELAELKRRLSTLESGD